MEKFEVRMHKIDTLGIREFISMGITYFRKQKGIELI